MRLVQKIKSWVCCLNSKRSKNIEYILATLNITCLIFYAISKFLISWILLPSKTETLFSFGIFFLLLSLIINALIILMRNKRLINDQLNNLAFFLSILMIFICCINILIHLYIYHSILKKSKTESKTYINYKISLLLLLILFINWIGILALWITDSIRIKIKTEDSYNNYLKKKTFTKRFVSFCEEINKTTKHNNDNIDLLNNNSNNIYSSKIEKNNIMNFDANNSNVSDKISIDLNNSGSSKSKNSDSLSDSMQNPVYMGIVGVDNDGNPIYAKQNSFDKSQCSSSSDGSAKKETKNNKYIIILNENNDKNNDSKEHDMEKINTVEENDGQHKQGLLEKINISNIGVNIEKKIEGFVALENEKENDNDNDNEIDNHNKNDDEETPSKNTV